MEAQAGREYAKANEDPRPKWCRKSCPHGYRCTDPRGHGGEHHSNRCRDCLGLPARLSIDQAQTFEGALAATSEMTTTEEIQEAIITLTRHMNDLNRRLLMQAAEFGARMRRSKEAQRAILLKAEEARRVAKQRSEEMMKIHIGRIVAPGQCDLGKLISRIAAWEADVAEYEKKTANVLGDETKAAVLIEMSPGVLREHLYLNAKSLLSYEAVREEIMKYLQRMGAPCTSWSSIYSGTFREPRSTRRRQGEARRLQEGGGIFPRGICRSCGDHAGLSNWCLICKESAICEECTVCSECQKWYLDCGKDGK